MKLMKKLMVVLVAVLLVMSMTSRIYADDSITISVDASGTPDENTAAEVYSAYKIFDVVKADSITGDVTTDDSIAAQPADPLPSGFAYTIDKNSKWYSVVSTQLTDYITLTAIAGDATKETVTLKDGVEATEATAKAIAAILEENIPEDAPVVQVTLGTAAEAAPGYYLIVSSIGSNLILGTTDITITQKNTYPTIEKLQKDEDASEYAESGVTVAVGDVINYQITVSVPESAKADLIVSDTMFAGLTYDDTSLTVTPGTYTTLPNTDAHYDANATWQIVITPSNANKGQDVVITFSATVNTDSIGVKDDVKKNTVVLDFSNFRQSDEVSYTTKASSIVKIDGKTEEELEGVKFTLKEDGTEFPVTLHAEGYYYYDANGSSEVVTDADGLIVIRGLDGDKTYTLTETETLEGYNLAKDPITLELVADDNNYSPDEPTPVPNNQGTVLPSTGGIGTTIFHVAGAALVLGAGIILISKKRVNG